MKSLLLRSIALPSICAFCLFGCASIVAHAQTAYTSPSGTVYSIPAGYQFYSDGIFYNPSVNTYYNAITGIYSSAAPSSTIVTQTGVVTQTGGIPPGYTIWGGGIYYNSSTNLYYNPQTGLYSNTFPGLSLPAGTTVVTSNTPVYGIPAGYVSTGTGGIYFNSATNQYFDPSTGRYWSPTSAMQISPTYNPTTVYTGTGYTGTSYTGTYYGTTNANAYAYNPSLPNTGVGGDAKRVLDIVMLALTLTLGGVAIIVRTWRTRTAYGR